MVEQALERPAVCDRATVIDNWHGMPPSPKRDSMIGVTLHGALRAAFEDISGEPLYAADRKEARWVRARSLASALLEVADRSV